MTALVSKIRAVIKSNLNSSQAPLTVYLIQIVNPMLGRGLEILLKAGFLIAPSTARECYLYETVSGRSSASVG